MKDVYKDVMDAVKAPDALVDKTLQLMLEKQKKLEMRVEADDGLTELDYAAVRQQNKAPKQRNNSPQGADYAPRRTGETPPKKNRWIPHVALPAAVCLCLFLSVTIPRLLNRQADVHQAPADSRYSQSPETPALDVNDTDGITEGAIEAMATDNLATRSGPATEYRETGTYQTKGEYVRLFSLAYDVDGLGWVQCEVSYGNELRRVYTGLQRFDTATFDPGSLPVEEPLDEQAKVTATSKAMYGPGSGYGTYAALTVDEGQTVTLITTENAYAQVEWTTSKQSYRAWVPIDTLILL